MSTPRPAIPACEPNITPMLDVLLVLLIIFMAMSIRVHHTVDAQLPQSCVGACGSTMPIVLEVLPGPSYRINRAPVSAQRLVAELAAIYRPRPDKIIQIAGHPGTTYQDVVAAIDVAKSAGVLVVGIAPKDSYLRR